MLKKIALAIALVCSGVSAQQTAGTTSGLPAGSTLDPSQVYNTVNLVNNTMSPTNTTGTWQNLGLVNQGLPCWGPGGPVYCGPQPYYNNGSFNFSYGITDVHQTVNINNALSSIGSGLQVNGYNFGFTAKNGNGWDDGRVDYLTAYVNFEDKSNKLAYSKSYDLNYKFDWTTFNFSETFDTPYASKDLKTVTYGFVGGDNNYWAGPYGPEIYNVSFSLKYSVDQCSMNVLSSPTCPGYLEALAKLAPAPTTVTSEPITTTSTSPTTTTTIVTDPIASTVSVTSTSTIAQPIVAPTTTTTSTTSTVTATKETQSNSSNTSLALSIISKNSERDATGAAVAQSAVSQAQQAAQQAQQEAASVASNAVANSLTVNAVSGSNQQTSGNGIKLNTTASTNFSLQPGITNLTSMLGPQTSSSTSAQQNAGSTAMSASINQPVSTANTVSQQLTSNTAATYALPLLQPQQSIVAPMNAYIQTEAIQQVQPITQNKSVTQTSETYSIVPTNFLTDRTNPLTDIIEAKQSVPQNNTIATTGPSVNKNAGNNEVAGGVDINKMALAPIGYGDYMNFTLKDAAFYAPKEVYKNQRNVDNARALRQMTNDSKHREMIEMQYVR